jgi:hypothetical protein
MNTGERGEQEHGFNRFLPARYAPKGWRPKPVSACCISPVFTYRLLPQMFEHYKLFLVFIENKLVSFARK